MTYGDISVPALSARVSWWLSCLQMTREQGTVSVVWVMCERNVHTVILWAHLVMVKTGLLSQWGRWWLTGSSLRSRYFHTMKPDTFFSGQYFTTWCTTLSASQWYACCEIFMVCTCTFHVFCELVCPCKNINHKITLAKFHFWVGLLLRYAPFWVHFSTTKSA